MDPFTNKYYAIFDCGINYANKNINERFIAQRLSNATESGVEKVVCISRNLNECSRNVRLSVRFEQLYYTIGCGPNQADQFSPGFEAYLDRNVNAAKCVGIGPIGIDLQKNSENLELQVEILTKQIQIAKKHQKPIFLYYRDTGNKVFGQIACVLKKEAYFNGIVHNFQGNLEQALYFTNRGFKLGITGFFTQYEEDGDEAAKITRKALKNKKISLDKIVVQSDSPFSGAQVKDCLTLVQELAILKKMDELTCGQILYQTSQALLLSSSNQTITQ